MYKNFLLKNWDVKIFLIIFLSCTFHKNIFSEIISGTLVRTIYGLVRVEELKVGDTVVSSESESNVKVKDIRRVDLLCAVVIEIENEIIFSGPDQLFFDPFLCDWVRAINLTEKNTLLDFEFNLHKCKKITFYEISTVAYEISLSFPHTFFITESQILVHNNIVAAVFNLTKVGVRACVSFFARNPGTINAIKAVGITVASWFGLRRAGIINKYSTNRQSKISDKIRNAEIKATASKDSQKGAPKIGAGENAQGGLSAPSPNNNGGGEKKPKKDDKFEKNKNNFLGKNGSVKPLGRGSTGRTQPRSLEEQLAMKELMSNPCPSGRSGFKIINKKGFEMTDKRWPASEGWVKVAKNIVVYDTNGKKVNIEIHFVWNRILNLFDDFKFKN